MELIENRKNNEVDFKYEAIINKLDNLKGKFTTECLSNS